MPSDKTTDQQTSNTPDSQADRETETKFPFRVTAIRPDGSVAEANYTEAEESWDAMMAIYGKDPNAPSPYGDYNVEDYLKPPFGGSVGFKKHGIVRRDFSRGCIEFANGWTIEAERTKGELAELIEELNRFKSQLMHDGYDVNSETFAQAVRESKADDRFGTSRIAGYPPLGMLAKAADEYDKLTASEKFWLTAAETVDKAGWNVLLPEPWNDFAWPAWYSSEPSHIVATRMKLAEKAGKRLWIASRRIRNDVFLMDCCLDESEPEYIMDAEAGLEVSIDVHENETVLGRVYIESMLLMNGNPSSSLFTSNGQKQLLETLQKLAAGWDKKRWKAQPS